MPFDPIPIAHRIFLRIQFYSFQINQSHTGSSYLSNPIHFKSSYASISNQPIAHQIFLRIQSYSFQINNHHSHTGSSDVSNPIHFKSTNHTPDLLTCPILFVSNQPPPLTHTGSSYVSNPIHFKPTTTTHTHPIFVRIQSYSFQIIPSLNFKIQNSKFKI